MEWWDKNFYEEFDEEVYPPPFTDAHGFHGHLIFLEDYRQDLIDCLNLGNFSMLEKPINGLLNEDGINPIDKSSLEYRKLCAEIHKAEIALIPLEDTCSVIFPTKRNCQKYFQICLKDNRSK